MEQHEHIPTNEELMESLKQDGLKNCPDCGAKPGEKHNKDGCDVEKCSVCGMQRIGCRCKGHDKAFARWTGIWPGAGEALALKTDLNGLYIKGYYEALFIKPKAKKRFP
jgi:hypothetical protein